VAQNSMQTSLRRRRDWLGLSCLVYDVCWGATPGWMSASFEQPTLCFLTEEIGGRGELRIRPDLPSEGEYFGAGHLTLLAAEAPITLHSSTLRQAQFACLPLRPREATCLSTEQAELIMRAPSRLMFHDTKLHTCAMMLSAYEGEDEHDAYGLGMRNALLASLVGVANGPMSRSKTRLTGPQFARVVDYINQHLDQRVTNDSLAGLAELSPTEFGSAFREATGLSPQRWQMDARVRSAQRLMVDTPTLSLSSVAVRSGFADQSHFSRAFLDILGVTPTAWLHERR
jgi:AraC family transcriptional regulator